MYDIVSLTEHWIPENVLNSVKLTNYRLALYFCRSVGNHRVASIFLKNSLKFRKRLCKKIIKEFESEFCAVELTDFNINIISVYRLLINLIQLILVIS